VSVDRAGRHHPLARSTGHGCDAIKGGVVVKDGEIAALGRGSYEEVGNLAAALMLRR
jgi:hypothetical protein